MNKKLFVEYLRYLHSEAERIMSRDAIDAIDIGNLERDIANFKKELSDSVDLPDRYKTLGISLNLNVTKRYLDGWNMRNFMISLFRMLLPFGRLWVIKNWEKTKDEVRSFRNQVDHTIYLAGE